MIINKLLFFSIMLFSNFIYAQHREKSIELIALEVKSEQFKKILNFIILYEKNCEYYTQDTVFIIDINQIASESFINIEAINDKNLALASAPFGFLYHNKHMFFIKGDKSSNLFFDTKIKKLFDYIDYDIFYEEYNSDGQKVLRMIIDDS